MTSKATVKTKPSDAPSPLKSAIVKLTLSLAGAGIAASTVLSYAAITAVAARCGLAPWVAWLYPLAVDVPMVAATLALAAMHSYPWKAQAGPAVTLLVFLGLTVWINGVHVDYLGTTLPHDVRVNIGRLPALTVFALVHLALVVSRRAEPRPAKAAPARSATQQSAPTAPAASETPAPVAPARATPAAARATRVSTGTGRTERDALREQAVRLAADGLSNRQIGERLGVAHTTISRWQSAANAESALDDRPTLFAAV